MKLGLIAAIACFTIIIGSLFLSSPTPATAQNTPRAVVRTNTTAATQSAQPASAPGTASQTSTNASAPATAATANVVTNATSTVATNVASAPSPNPAPPRPPGPGAPAPTPETPVEPLASSDEISLSFQGANIEMVVQWLAKATGKSVVKHPQVQCQLTIVSSKKLTAREAINLVYRALSLEGFVAVESSNSILIVPEGKEPKMSPEILDGQKDIPEGRQRLIKVFPLKHVQPTELREKVRPVLSDKATIDVDERASQLIVTDYNENLRLLTELIKELDVASASDSVIEMYPLKYSEAEELGTLLGLVLNSQAAASSSGSSSRSSPNPMGGPPNPGGPPPPMASPPGGGGASGGAAGQQVRIWPDKTANRIIVAAPKSKIPEVQRLIKILDSEKPQDVSVRVITLKHVSAEDLVKEIQPLYQKMGTTKGGKDAVEVTANSRSNSLIILSSEANFKAIDQLVSKLDTEEAQEKTVRTFPLKNADAEDVAKQLQELSQDQQSSSRYSYYFYSPPSRSGKKMSVVADRRRNTVIVQAPPGAMEGIAKMIKELDEPVGDNSLAPKIFALKYVSAVDIEDVLNELFLKKTQQRTYWYFDEFPQETADRNVGRLYGKVRITSEPYSNSLIVTANSQEHLAAVEEVLTKLDVPSQAGETTVRIELKFAEAITIASSMNILFAKGGSPPLRATPQQPQQNDNRGQQQQNNSYSSNFELEKETKEDAYYPWLGGQPENYRSSDGRNTVRPVSDLVGRVRVVPDRRSNSLMVSANVHLLPQVLKLINELDAPTAQVLIEAKIIEVASDFRDKLGVRWSPDGNKVFTADDMDNSIMGGTRGSYRRGFGENTTINSGSPISTLATLRSGVLESTVNLDLLVQFLRKNSDATVLAEPHLSIKDNELGKLFVGSQVPVPDNSQVTQLGGQNTTFRYKDVGVILEVTPHINNSQEVALKIRAESSTVRPGETILGGAVVDARSFRTDLMVKSGDTVVLGGIIQHEQTDTLRKTPLLGSIPVLGWAFKKKDKVSREVELMVFLKPIVTKTPDEAKALVNEVEKKTPRIKESEEQRSKK